ncbi:MAG: class I SAM-dependent methyltransferase [Elusimicrobia bacterium]|nr:class I SAM-dependent methyltransferase [Elusimicrobiota bacterium]
MTNARPCPLCADPAARPALALSGGIEIVRCAACGLLFRPAVPHDLRPLYGESYFKDYFHAAGTADSRAPREYAADRERLVGKFSEHLERLERFKAPGRLLEIGCARGYLLEAAKRRGWDATGLDISAFAADSARAEFGARVVTGTVEAAPFEDGAFDAVVALEYIEHVADPVATLRRVRPWLAPGGVLMISTPNAGSRAARAHPETFDGFLETVHFSYFTRSTMKELLTRSGFEPVEIRTDNALVTTDTLAGAGVKSPERWRALANLVAPGLKAWIRGAAGRWLEGPSMIVIAAPRKAGR